MRAAQMRSGIIIGAVALPIATSLAVCEEVLARRDIDADPDRADGSVHALDVAAELVLAVEPIRMVRADAAVCLWSRGSAHGGLGDRGDFLCCAVCGGDADHLVVIDLGHAAGDRLDLWSNAARGLGDLLFGASHSPGALLAVDAVEEQAIVGHWVARGGGWGSGS